VEIFKKTKSKKGKELQRLNLGGSKEL